MQSSSKPSYSFCPEKRDPEQYEESSIEAAVEKEGRRASSRVTNTALTSMVISCQS